VIVGVIGIVAVVGLVAVGNNTAAAEELPPRGMEYEQGQNRRLDIWVGQMDEKSQVSS
jgi:hypothetical protein